MKTIQCKNIPDEVILKYIVIQPTSAFLSEVFAYLPQYPEKMLLAKLKKLINKNLIEGCACGCRGDFRITDKGKAFLHTLNK